MGTHDGRGCWVMGPGRSWSKRHICLCERVGGSLLKRVAGFWLGDSGIER
jgi:hypothetical protein